MWSNNKVVWGGGGGGGGGGVLIEESSSSQYSKVEYLTLFDAILGLNLFNVT